MTRCFCALSECQTYLGDEDRCPRCGTPRPQWQPAVRQLADLPGRPLLAPLVVGDAVIVAMGIEAHPVVNSVLQAIDLATGQARWTLDLPGLQVAGLDLDQSGLMLCVSATSTQVGRGGQVLGVRPGKGHCAWRWASGASFFSAPLVNRETIYLVTGEKKLVALSIESGQMKWEMACNITPAAAAGALALASATQTLYLPCRAPKLTAVDPAGQRVLWQTALSSQPGLRADLTPLVVGDLVCTALSNGEAVACRTGDGHIVWRARLGTANQPLAGWVAAGETLFAGLRDGTVVALSAGTGRVQWSYATPPDSAGNRRPLSGSPLYHRDVLYVAGENHYLHALDALSGRELWQVEPSKRRIEVGPALGGDAILVADRGQRLWAVERIFALDELVAHERWVEAACALATQNNILGAANLLENHDEPLKAASLWETMERLAPPQKSHAFRQKACICRKQPYLTLGVRLLQPLEEHEWGPLQLEVANLGRGKAVDIGIKEVRGHFEGSLKTTQKLAALNVNQWEEWRLSIYPLAPGKGVPLRFVLTYHDTSGTRREHQQEIEVPVARQAQPGAITVIGDGNVVGDNSQSYVEKTAGPLSQEEAWCKPYLTATNHPLPFSLLDARDFERLTLWLARAEGYQNVEHLGASGSEPGPDVIAWRDGGLWRFQCQRVKKIGAAVLRKEVDSIVALAGREPDKRLAGIIFVITCDVAAAVRDEVRGYCREQALACRFWAWSELDLMTKKYPDIVREFFNLPG
jgi:outer membrane protein assembly factor BamB